MPTKALRFLLCLAPAFALYGSAQAADARKPNVVILMDDLGYSDIRRPNIGKLAQKGVRFMSFHNTARQAGVGQVTDEQDWPDGKPLPGDAGRLNDHCVILAEALHEAGYFRSKNLPAASDARGWAGLGIRQGGLMEPYGAAKVFPGTAHSVVIDLESEQAD